MSLLSMRNWLPWLFKYFLTPHLWHHFLCADLVTLTSKKQFDTRRNPLLQIVNCKTLDLSRTKCSKGINDFPEVQHSTKIVLILSFSKTFPNFVQKETVLVKSGVKFLCLNLLCIENVNFLQRISRLLHFRFSWTKKNSLSLVK